MRSTKSYAAARNAPPPRSPYLPVRVVSVEGRHDVYENGLWSASFREATEAEEYRRKRLRLPWRIPAPS